MTVSQSHLEALVSVQRTRKAVLLGGVVLGMALLLTGTSSWTDGTLTYEAIKGAGLLLLLCAVLGRTWCSAYIGGRKSLSLINSGPYSVTRNPLYLFSVIGAVGAGAQTGSFIFAAAAGVVTYLIFLPVILREERALEQAFGEPYRKFLSEVPRFLPNFTLWRCEGELKADQRRVLITFVDSLFFLLAIPLAYGVKHMHLTGLVPTLFQLP